MNLEQFSGVNAGYVLELYEKYRRDPESVDPATRQAFESWKPSEPSEAAAARLNSNSRKLSFLRPAASN